MPMTANQMTLRLKQAKARKTKLNKMLSDTNKRISMYEKAIQKARAAASKKTSSKTRAKATSRRKSK